MKVFISASSRVEDEEYLQIAKDVASILTKKDFDLITGGVASGIMKQVFLEFKSKNKHTIVTTLKVYEEDLSRVDEVYFTDNTFDRCKKIYDLMDVVLFLPGGTGSLEELLAMLEEARTLVAKPLILYNANGHFDKVLEIFADFIKLGFNNGSILDKIYVVSSLEELEEKINKLIREKENNYE